jgi:hypothetical protein
MSHGSLRQSYLWVLVQHHAQGIAERVVFVVHHKRGVEL